MTRELPPRDPWQDLALERVRTNRIRMAVETAPVEFLKSNTQFSESEVKRGVCVSQSIVSEYDPQSPNGTLPCLVLKISPELWERGIRFYRNFEGFRVFIVQEGKEA